MRPSSLWTSGGLACALSVVGPAYALDKQGSAHGGEVGGSDNGFAVSGSAGLGVALVNPTYAARPNNTGLALMRYLAHADIDLIGERLSIPLDVNLFSDRTRGGLAALSPTELDLIAGVTSTWNVGKGAVELGARGELDSPVQGDPTGYKQGYADVRARYLYSVAAMSPGFDRALAGGDVSGWATLGVFAFNPTYAARPDNSGKALLRYGLHVETSFFDQHFAIGLDYTMFTDRETNAVAPSELDYTAEVIGRFDPFEFHLAYEVDAPVDGRGDIPGYSQKFVYALAMWSFDLSRGAKGTNENAR